MLSSKSFIIYILCLNFIHSEKIFLSNVHASHCSHIQLFVALWTVAYQPTRLLCPWDFPGKNTGVGCHALLQGIFATQELNPCLLHLLHWQIGSLSLAPPGKPISNVRCRLRFIFFPPWTSIYSSETVWALEFLSQVIFNYELNFLNSYRAI